MHAGSSLGPTMNSNSTHLKAAASRSNQRVGSGNESAGADNILKHGKLSVGN